MPNIPIAKIPNAPQTSGRAVYAPVDSMRGVNLRRGANLIQNASGMMNFERGKEGLFGSYEGLQDLGEAGARAADVLGDWSLKMQQANDEANYALADTAIRDAQAKFEAESMTLPPEQHVSTWQDKYLPKLEEQIGALPQSKRLRSLWDTSKVTTTNSIYVGAVKQTIQNQRQQVMNSVDRAIAEDRIPDAYGSLARAEQAGLVNSSEGERIRLEVDKKQREQTNSTLWANTVGRMQAYYADPTNPIEGGLAESIDAAVQDQSWYSPYVEEYKGKPQEMLRLQSIAGQMRQDAIIDRKKSAISAIANNMFQTPDEIREAYKAALPEAEVESMVDMFNRTPQEQDRLRREALTVRPRLVAAVEAYDPDEDPERTTEATLIDAIHTLPVGYQSSLIDSLQEARRRGKAKVSDALDEIKTVTNTGLEAGAFGRFKTDDKGKPDPGDMGAWVAARGRRSTLLLSMDKWARNNPKEAADPAKMWGKYNEMYSNLSVSMTAAGIGFKKSQDVQAYTPAAEDVRRRTEEIRQQRQQRGAAPADTTGTVDPQAAADDNAPETYTVVNQTRDTLSGSRAGSREVSLDFNSGGAGSTGVEIVIPHDATEEEKRKAAKYTRDLTAWFKKKGVDVPNRGVLTRTGKGEKVSRFHTEPFFIQDQAARQAIMDDPDGYAEVVAKSLGTIPGVRIIPPHELSDKGSSDGTYNEQDFAREHIIPALQRRQEKQLARK